MNSETARVIYIMSGQAYIKRARDTRIEWRGKTRDEKIDASYETKATPRIRD